MAQLKVYAGIDVGTTATKAVLINAQKEILGSFIVRSGANLSAAAESVYEQAIALAGIDRGAVQTIVATGYGRKSVDIAHSAKTEISCHGRGCHHYFPQAITIVDIGGQDSKVIKLDQAGKRSSFKMNRKCAAGTGAFLEEMAHKLEVPVSELNNLAQSAASTAQIGSYCTVFTATEVLDRIREGENLNEIVRGLFDSVAKRIVEMDTLTERVVMSGGVVAYHPIVAELLSARAGVEVEIAPHPQEMGAFGAALFALESA
jgi:predicted CoA-substrate-specific enzyme activase